MKERRVYWRWKGSQYILEGRLPNKKAVTLWTLPDANRFVHILEANESFPTREKNAKILELYGRLEYKALKSPKGFSKDRLINIKRSSKKVENTSHSDEETKEMLWKLTK